MHCYVPGSLCLTRPRNRLKSSNVDVSYIGQLAPCFQYRTTFYLYTHRIKAQLIQLALTIHTVQDATLFVNFFQSKLVEVWTWQSEAHWLSFSVLPNVYGLLELARRVFLQVLCQVYLSMASYSFKLELH